MAENAVIGALRVVIGADTAALEKGLKDAQSAVGSFGSGVSKIAGNILNLKNAVAAIAGGALVEFVKSAVEAGDEVAKTAQKLGVTTDSLQEMRYAAQATGVDTQTFNTALAVLEKNLGDTSGAVTPATTALGKLGLTMANLKGLNPTQAFQLIADRMNGVSDASQKANISAALFGRSFKELQPLLQLGSAGMAQLGADAHKLGLVLSEETIKKSTEAKDEFEKIGDALKVAGVNIAVGFLPALEDVRKTVTSQDFQDGIKNLASNFGSLISWMVDHKSEMQVAAGFLAGLRVGGLPGGAIGSMIPLANWASEIGDAKEMATLIEKTKDEITDLQGKLAGVAEKMAATNSPTLLGQLATQAANLKTKIAEDQQQLEYLQKTSRGQPTTKITVNPSPSTNAGVPFDAATKAAIEELDFKTRVLNQDFAALAPGFADAAKGLKQFGVEAHPAVTSVGELSPQLQQLNTAMLQFKGVQLTQDNLTPWQLYEQQLAQINLLQSSGVISLETYQAALLKLKFPSLAQGIRDASDLNKQVDQFATSSVNNFASAISSIADGSKTAGEAFKAFGMQVLDILVQMIVKMLVLKAIEIAIGFAGGGPIPDSASAMGGAGLSASDVNPSPYATGGIAGVGGSVVGPGSGTSDSILTRLSNGEFVVNADSTRRFLPLLNAINYGGLQGMAAGGLAGGGGEMIDASAMAMNDNAAGATTLHLHVGDMTSKDGIRRIAAAFEDLSRNGRKLKIKVA